MSDLASYTQDVNLRVQRRIAGTHADQPTNDALPHRRRDRIEVSVVHLRPARRRERGENGAHCDVGAVSEVVRQYGGRRRRNYTYQLQFRSIATRSLAREERCMPTWQRAGGQTKRLAVLSHEGRRGALQLRHCLYQPRPAA